MDKELKIIAWNSNGLLQHQRELQVVLDTENIDVCLISETHFTKESFIKLKGYKVYHAIHPTNSARGGSAVIIKDNIYHFEESKYEKLEIQAVAVSIKTERYPITIVSIYCPPRYALKKQEYVRFLEQYGHRFIIGGDFNAKNVFWGSRLTTTKGKELLSAIKDMRCDVVSTGMPTYWPTDPLKIPDLIDFFISKNISPKYLNIEGKYDMNSDHSPILLTMNKHSIVFKETKLTLVNSKTDWESFRIELDSVINLKVPLKSPEQLNKELGNFITNIQKSAWNNTPPIKKWSKGTTYPKEIIDLIRIKRKQRKTWHASRSPQDKSILNKLTKTIKIAIKSYNENKLNNYLQNLTNDRETDYSLWKVTGNLKRPITHIPPIKEKSGKWAINNTQKANRFAQHLEDIFQPNDGHPIDVCDAENKEKQEDLLNITLVTPKEVSKEIKINLSKKKSPGYDLITGEVLNNLPRKALVKLTNLINASFRLRYVPELWKVAEVIMIAKPGKPPHEATSYRPISLLPVISKLFEKLLLKRLKPLLDEKKLIPDHQFGFREKHSTIDQVHRITDIIEKSLEDKKVCSTVFLDVAQAFDKVWHEGLIYKLRTMLPKSFADILESYISNRWFRVRQEDAYSEIKEIKAGVPQGSVLGPVLYLLYTCDIPDLENNTIATFADDTAIIGTAERHEEAVEKVQEAINKVNEWTIKWRIKLNESKSKHIDFSNKLPQYHPIYLNRQLIPYVNKAKYLGMTLDTKLRWKAHVKKKREELDLRYKKMNWLLGRHSTLSLNNKIILYKQVLMPVWTYGIQLWGCTKPSNVQVIQRFQNKVLREIANAPWYVRNHDLHRDLKIEFVNKIIQKYAEAHHNRLRHHVNLEAIKLVDNVNINRRLKRKKPFELV